MRRASCVHSWCGNAHALSAAACNCRLFVVVVVVASFATCCCFVGGGMRVSAACNLCAFRRIFCQLNIALWHAAVCGMQQWPNIRARLQSSSNGRCVVLCTTHKSHCIHRARLVPGLQESDVRLGHPCGNVARAPLAACRPPSGSCTLMRCERWCFVADSWLLCWLALCLFLLLLLFFIFFCIDATSLPQCDFIRVDGQAVAWTVAVLRNAIFRQHTLTHTHNHAT